MHNAISIMTCHIKRDTSVAWMWWMQSWDFCSHLCFCACVSLFGMCVCVCVCLCVCLTCVCVWQHVCLCVSENTFSIRDGREVGAHHAVARGELQDRCGTDLASQKSLCTRPTGNCKTQFYIIYVKHSLAQGVKLCFFIGRHENKLFMKNIFWGKMWYRKIMRIKTWGKEA